MITDWRPAAGGGSGVGGYHTRGASYGGGSEGSESDHAVCPRPVALSWKSATSAAPPGPPVPIISTRATAATAPAARRLAVRRRNQVVQPSAAPSAASARSRTSCQEPAGGS